MDDFPRSIRSLRVALPDPIAVSPRTIWQPFEAFLLEHGYQLWVAKVGWMSPPSDDPRAPDGFIYRSSDVSVPGSFAHTRPTICPARTKDGRDVIIRIVSIGDSGIQHKTALERLATGNVASVIGNHAVPVLQWLSYQDITFAVFPFLAFGEPCLNYGYEDARDILNTLVQLLEAVEFCHSRLVSHRDIFEGNILGNYVDNPPPDAGPDGRPKPFRSTFPFRLFLNDFEFAVCFDPDSDPQTHLTVGKPITEEEGTYARPVAPELESKEPYSPFCLDIWQLSTYFCVLPIYGLPMPVKSVIEWMQLPDPAERPTAREALETMQLMISNMSETELKAPALDYDQYIDKTKSSDV